MDRHHDQTRPEPTGNEPTRPANPSDTQPAVWLVPRAQRPGYLSPELARLLLRDRTQVGDVVLDIDDDIALATTAAATGRRHHALDGAQHLAAMGHAAGDIDLIVLHWPRPAVNPHWLLRACRSLLGTTGCLVIVVSVEAGQRIGHLRALAGVAATAGLRAVQHVAVLDPGAATPPSTGETGRGRRSSRPASRPRTGRGRRGTTYPHTDLLIFSIEAATDE